VSAGEAGSAEKMVILLLCDETWVQLSNCEQKCSKID
jgi:hypothetical protein